MLTNIGFYVNHSFLLNGEGVEKRYNALMVCFSDMFLNSQVRINGLFIVVFLFRSLGRSVQRMLLPCSTLGQIFCKPLAALEVSFQLIFVLIILTPPPHFQ